MRTEFIIPENLHFEDLQSILQKNTRVLTEPSRTVYLTYYDSFDWRLYQKDSLLEGILHGNQHTLVWRRLQGEPACPPLKLNEIPSFTRDLPPGQLRNLLAAVMEMRELAPKVRIRSRVRLSETLQTADRPSGGDGPGRGKR
jgi:hypothetical protein